MKSFLTPSLSPSQVPDLSTQGVHTGLDQVTSSSMKVSFHLLQELLATKRSTYTATMRLQNIAMGRVATNHDTSISSLSRNHRHQSHQTTLYKVRTCLQVSVSPTIRTTSLAFNPSHTKILGVRRWIALASWTRAMPQLLLWTCKISLSYIQMWECRLIQLMDSASNKTRCSKIRSMNILRTSSRWEVTQWHNLKAHQDSSWVCTEITWC